MDNVPEEKRQGGRRPLSAGTALTLRGLPLTNPGVTVNVSSSGVLLRFQSPVELEPGQTVICDFAPGQSQGEGSDLPCWAAGRVIRVDGTDVALQFTAASYDDGEDAGATAA